MNWFFFNCHLARHFSLHNYRELEITCSMFLKLKLKLSLTSLRCRWCHCFSQLQPLLMWGIVDANYYNHAFSKKMIEYWLIWMLRHLVLPFWYQNQVFVSIREIMSARKKAITKTAPEPRRGVRFLEIECWSQLQKFESYGGSSRATVDGVQASIGEKMRGGILPCTLVIEWKVTANFLR